MWRSFIRKAEPTDKIPSVDMERTNKWQAFPSVLCFRTQSKTLSGGTDRAFDCVKGEFPDLLISSPNFSIRTLVEYNKVDVKSITILWFLNTILAKNEKRGLNSWNKAAKLQE